MTDLLDESGPLALACIQGDDASPVDIPPILAPFIRILQGSGCTLPDTTIARLLTWLAKNGPVMLPAWHPFTSAPRDRAVDLWAVSHESLHGRRFADCLYDPDETANHWRGLPLGWSMTHWTDPPSSPTLPPDRTTLDRVGPLTGTRASVLARVLSGHGLCLPMDAATRLLMAFLSAERAEVIGLPGIVLNRTPEGTREAWAQAGIIEFLPAAARALSDIGGDDAGLA